MPPEDGTAEMATRIRDLESRLARVEARLEREDRARDEHVDDVLVRSRAAQRRIARYL